MSAEVTWNWCMNVFEAGGCHGGDQWVHCLAFPCPAYLYCLQGSPHEGRRLAWSMWWQRTDCGGSAEGLKLQPTGFCNCHNRGCTGSVLLWSQANCPFQGLSFVCYWRQKTWAFQATTQSVRQNTVLQAPGSLSLGAGSAERLSGRGFRAKTWAKVRERLYYAQFLIKMFQIVIPSSPSIWLSLTSPMRISSDVWRLDQVFWLVPYPWAWSAGIKVWKVYNDAASLSIFLSLPRSASNESTASFHQQQAPSMHTYAQ